MSSNTSLSKHLLEMQRSMQAALVAEAKKAFLALQRIGGGRIKVVEDSFLGYPSVYASDSRVSILELRGLKTLQGGDPAIVTDRGTLKAPWEQLPFEEVLQVLDILTKAATTYGEGENPTEPEPGPEENGAEPYYVPGRGVAVPSAGVIVAMRDEPFRLDFVRARAQEAPSLEVWKEIYRHKETIDSLLVRHGGELLEGPVYWTSSMIPGYRKAYVFHINTGHMRGSIVTTEHPVRTVSTL